MKQPIRILIADDHAVVRRGLRSILQIEKDFQIAGEAASGAEAVEMARQLKPQVVIMDLIMPEKSGSEATAEILTELPETRILLLTTFGTADDVTKALEAGAVGALMKTSDESEIISSIRTVAAGGRAVSDEIKRLIEENPPTPELTPRQLEILNSLSRGYSNAEIAEVFGINEFTVREHVANIMAKLDASNRAEAVAIALRRSLLKF
ncbi:MAG: response regulator transcription factor [Kiritimatiellae bacterium]|nr:response regulator transcription factor [Kiritimatiellia bacterium]